MSRILIAGGTGMLGRDLTEVLRVAGHDVTSLGSADLDVADLDSALAAADNQDIIINAAAYTRVDDAESDEEAAYAVNALGAATLAAAAVANEARFYHLSTDYVFDGTATEPYAEDAPRNPVSAYGRTKAEAERWVLDAHPSPHIIRTAWLYGEHGPNFVSTMLRLAGERETVSVVTDQIGQPTWSRDLAAQILAMIDHDVPEGIYHGTSTGQVSWFDFARAIFAGAGLDAERVAPTTSADFVRPAARPAYSVLGHERWATVGLTPMRPWNVALTDALPELITAT